MGYDIEKNVVMRSKLEVIHSPLLDMVNLLHLELKQKTENNMKLIIKLLKSVDFFKEPAIGFTD